MKKYPSFNVFLTLLLLGVFGFNHLVLAQASVSGDTITVDDSAEVTPEVDQLQQQAQQKQNRIKELDGMIQKYRDQAAVQETQTVSLQNEVALIENRIQEKQLSVERAKREIESTLLEIQALDRQASAQQEKITKRESALADIFVKLQQESSVSTFNAFMARPSISEMFAHLDQLGRLEGDLGEATRVLKSEKSQLVAKRKDQDARRVALETQQLALEAEQQDLEEQHASKVSLATVTQLKENEFNRMIYELRQQQQTEAGDIQSLQDSLKSRLDSVESSLARGDILLSWPIQAKKGVSAIFHDPSYPFRKLFEHPGVDLPTPVGTAVHASAGGYVAWTRTGKQYGNYIMVVHAGGVATIYAHLSKFAVQPDSYVDRGDIIGYSGGRPGDEGAGLSTGAHLHFEVRQNGIPVDPMSFLPGL